MCDRVVLIAQGRIAADSTVADLESRYENLEAAFRELTGGAAADQEPTARRTDEPEVVNG